MNATVYRLRSASDGEDRYGNTVLGAPARTILPGSFVAPRTAEDLTGQGRHGVIVGLSLFGTYGTDLEHTDQVEVDGTIYDIDGDPGQWKHPRTDWEAGFEVALVRTKG